MSNGLDFYYGCVADQFRRKAVAFEGDGLHAIGLQAPHHSSE
jgi:hypothetical protein